MMKAYKRVRASIKAFERIQSFRYFLSKYKHFLQDIHCTKIVFMEAKANLKFNKNQNILFMHFCNFIIYFQCYLHPFFG